MNKRKINSIEISFKINGNKIKKVIKPSLLLIELIREELGLTGTKPGCMEGECGACSVLVNGTAINSCLHLAINVDGKEITTIEGFSSTENTSRVIPTMIKHGSIQCGFCSSGMAVSISSMQNHFNKKNRFPDQEEIKKYLEGNLCRCTGYVKIISAATEVLKN